MRLVFFGTPEFAVPSLRALHAAGHDIAAVYTLPPRPAGRGHREQQSPVHAAAQSLGLPVRTPKTLRDESEQRAFAELRPEVGIVVAYGLLLPEAIYAAPPHGCLNLHASLLPRWRGAAPIPHAILAGDTRHGFTVMQIEAGLDTGAIRLQQSVDVGPRPTAPQLHDALAEHGARGLVASLEALAAGRLPSHPQPEQGATVAPKISPEDARLDWSRPAAELDARVRAFTPAAWFETNGERLRVVAAELVAGLPSAGPPSAVPPSAGPGTVLPDFTIVCGTGALRVTQIQRPGKQPMDADAFLRGYNLPANLSGG